jgi:diacylglycerol kinase
MSSLVLSLEIINTSIENLVDLMTDNYHPKAEKAKDAAAAAVLLSSIISILVGLIIFIPYLF